VQLAACETVDHHSLLTREKEFPKHCYRSKWLEAVVVLVFDMRTVASTRSAKATGTLTSLEFLQPGPSTLTLLRGGDLSQCDRCLGALIRVQCQPFLVREIP
jgi:hypothetical protein